MPKKRPLHQCGVHHEHIALKELLPREIQHSRWRDNDDDFVHIGTNTLVRTVRISVDQVVYDTCPNRALGQMRAAQFDAIINSVHGVQPRHLIRRNLKLMRTAVLHDPIEISDP